LDNKEYFLQCDTDTEHNRLCVIAIAITFIDGESEGTVDRYGSTDDTLLECMDHIVEGNFDDLQVTDDAKEKELY
jgi:hypothetical protein